MEMETLPLSRFTRIKQRVEKEDKKDLKEHDLFLYQTLDDIVEKQLELFRNNAKKQDQYARTRKEGDVPSGRALMCLKFKALKDRFIITEFGEHEFINMVLWLVVACRKIRKNRVKQFELFE